MHAAVCEFCLLQVTRKNSQALLDVVCGCKSRLLERFRAQAKPGTTLLTQADFFTTMDEVISTMF